MPKRRGGIDMTADVQMINLFQQKAELVSAFVNRIDTLDAAFDYAVDLCDRKEACQLLISGCEAPLSRPAEALCDTKQKKIIAAPALSADPFSRLQALAGAKGIDVIRDDLRDHLAGIDIGLTFIDYGIAETGTLVLDSSSEDTRLATMISEFHIAILPTASIRPRSFDLETEIGQMLRQSPNYTAFITGASRTADIERVLALGVHGPLELHILLLEI
jgi:L-lactate dehydrogenase complex protein LldG